MALSEAELDAPQACYPYQPRTSAKMNSELIAKLNDRTAKIGIVGLGSWKPCYAMQMQWVNGWWFLLQMCFPLLNPLVLFLVPKFP